MRKTHLCTGVWSGGGGWGLMVVQLGGMRSEPAPWLPWVLSVVPCQRAGGHAHFLWRGGKWVVEVWPLITSSRRDHSPPQGLSRVAVFSVVERKKKKREEIICYFFRLGWTTAFLGWECRVATHASVSQVTRAPCNKTPPFRFKKEINLNQS